MGWNRCETLNSSYWYFQEETEHRDWECLCMCTFQKEEVSWFSLVASKTRDAHDQLSSQVLLLLVRSFTSFLPFLIYTFVPYIHVRSLYTRSFGHVLTYVHSYEHPNRVNVSQHFPREVLLKVHGRT